MNPEKPKRKYTRRQPKPEPKTTERDVLFEGTIQTFRSDPTAVSGLNSFLNAPIGRKLWSALSNARPKGRSPSNTNISSDELIGYISGFEACLTLIRAMATPDESAPDVPSTWDDPDSDGAPELE